MRNESADEDVDSFRSFSKTRTISPSTHQLVSDGFDSTAERNSPPHRLEHLIEDLSGP